jgi:hypothetical protein
MVQKTAAEEERRRRKNGMNIKFLGRRSSPFAQSTPHILNFKLLVEMSTQPQALQDCFLQL